MAEYVSLFSILLWRISDLDPSGLALCPLLRCPRYVGFVLTGSKIFMFFCTGQVIGYIRPDNGNVYQRGAGDLSHASRKGIHNTFIL